jgi:uncharacterized cupredoxin-like copper-binding protein
MYRFLAQKGLFGYMFVERFMRNPTTSMFVAKILSGVLLSSFFAFNASASGSHSDGHNNPVGVKGEASAVSRTVEVNMVDNFYEPEVISVSTGETIRFKIKNSGELVHEFNIGTAAMHADHQKEMMMMVEHGALEADRINHDMMKMDMGGGKTMTHDDPNSVLLEPGQEAEIIWKFSDPVQLEFACNVPGHYEAGMMGSIQFN